jgi:hypothetical protein
MCGLIMGLDVMGHDVCLCNSGAPAFWWVKLDGAEWNGAGGRLRRFRTPHTALSAIKKFLKAEASCRRFEVS